MKKIEGGICAAKGFTANGIHCGIRKNKQKKDLSLIVSERPAACAAVYLHGLAGDLAATELGEYCLAPSDLIRCLPRAFQMLNT